MVIFCPFHKSESNEDVEATCVGTFDDEDFNHVGTVETNRFRCTVDPTHEWTHPSKNYWLRSMAWGPTWKQVRDRTRSTPD